jgi:hypothetical protein
LVKLHFSTKSFLLLVKPPPFGKPNIFFWLNFYISTKPFFYFWLNHYLFGIVHTQENLKGIMEGDDYRQ